MNLHALAPRSNSWKENIQFHLNCFRILSTKTMSKKKKTGSNNNWTLFKARNKAFFLNTTAISNLNRRHTLCIMKVRTYIYRAAMQTFCLLKKFLRSNHKNKEKAKAAIKILQITKKTSFPSKINSTLRSPLNNTRSNWEIWKNAFFQV